MPPTPRYVTILETALLTLIALGLATARVAVQAPGAAPTYLVAGAILAALAAFTAFHGACRAPAKPHPPRPSTEPCFGRAPRLSSLP
ncbi:hypothetical protein [Nocardia sp. CS682]|uniref:hypothetical protein n=1 Tax=Nocardia sp. CS682 TaxID=1047172 RepID=UPI0010754FC1|nr:hypothetical protein [Nocardia sp. CS682]